MSNNFDPAILEGWGVRPADWEFGASVQQEILPRVSLEVGYFRRWLQNFYVNDNLATTPSDFTAFSVTAPLDPRLPGGGGNTIDGLYDVGPTKFGQIDNYFTDAENFGEFYQRYNGFLLNLTARPRNGLALQGGLLTGKTVRDLCGIRNANPELDFVTAANASGPGNVYAQPTFPYCHFDSSFTTRVTGLATYTIPKVDVLVSRHVPQRSGLAALGQSGGGERGHRAAAGTESVVGPQRLGHREPDRAGNAVWGSGERVRFPHRQGPAVRPHPDQRRVRHLQRPELESGVDLQPGVQHGHALAEADRGAAAALREDQRADRFLEEAGGPTAADIGSVLVHAPLVGMNAQSLQYAMA